MAWLDHYRASAYLNLVLHSQAHPTYIVFDPAWTLIIKLISELHVRRVWLCKTRKMCHNLIHLIWFSQSDLLWNYNCIVMCLGFRFLLWAINSYSLSSVQMIQNICCWWSINYAYIVHHIPNVTHLYAIQVKERGSLCLQLSYKLLVWYIHWYQCYMYSTGNLMVYNI